MPEFEFKPVVLKWARESSFGPKIEALRDRWAASWTDASPELISEWERGESAPSFAQVRRLAEIYKRPLAVFFLDRQPDEKRIPPDLRTIGSKDNELPSPELLLAIRKARRVQEIAADLSRDLGEKLAFKYGKHGLSEDPSALAEHIRSDLSVLTSVQFGSRKFEDFFEYLRRKFESAGVVTLKSGLQDSFPTADCRAFSFADQRPFLILVNNKDREGAKNFSLVHEFAHLLLGTQGICNNFRTFGNKKGVSEVEVFCNQFAASFLVPRDLLTENKALKGKTRLASDEVDDLANRLALEFKVSRVVILRRLLTLDFVSVAVYKTKVKAWDAEEVRPKKPGGRFSLKTVLSKNGMAFSSLVLEAYRGKKVSYSAMSDYLGIKTKHLPKFEQLIDSYAR